MVCPRAKKIFFLNLASLEKKISSHSFKNFAKPKIKILQTVQKKFSELKVFFKKMTKAAISSKNFPLR